ncbi:hypothetical protein ACIPJG_20435 [Streptomyces halstedii]|uniref:hypothetical protein n=1 Tax=Streptomyces halstedii TaxID=1944 RepID=UPI0037F2C7F9
MGDQPKASGYLLIGGLVGIPLGFGVSIPYSEQAYCWRHPDLNTNTVHNGIPCTSYDFPAWQGVVGTGGLYLAIAALITLLLAIIVFVKEVMQGYH